MAQLPLETILPLIQSKELKTVSTGVEQLQRWLESPPSKIHHADNERLAHILAVYDALLHANNYKINFTALKCLQLQLQFMNGALQHSHEARLNRAGSSSASSSANSNPSAAMIATQHPTLKPSWIPIFLDLLQEKLADSKPQIRVAANDCILELCYAFGFGMIFDKLSRSMDPMPGVAAKSPLVRSSILSLFMQIADMFTHLQTLNSVPGLMKRFADSVIKAVGDPNVQVREQALLALQVLYSNVGDEILLKLSATPPQVLRANQVRVCFEKLQNITLVPENVRITLNAPSAPQVVLRENVEKQTPISPTKAEVVAASLGKLKQQQAMKRLSLGARVGSAKDPAVVEPLTVHTDLPAQYITATLSPASMNGNGSQADPLAISSDVKPIKLYSPKELESEMMALCDTLRDTLTAGWQERITALKKLQGLLEGGAQYFDNFQGLLRFLREPLQAQILDLRSAVVREACVTLAFLGRKLGDSFEGYVDYFFPSLFKLLLVSIQVVKESGNECVRSLLQSAPHCNKALPRIFEGATAASSSLRLRCMEFILLLLEVGNPYITDKYVLTLHACLKARLADKNEEVRQKARQACCAYLMSSAGTNAEQWCASELDEKTLRLLNEERIKYEALRNGMVSPNSGRASSSSAANSRRKTMSQQLNAEEIAIINQPMPNMAATTQSHMRNASTSSTTANPPLSPTVKPDFSRFNSPLHRFAAIAPDHHHLHDNEPQEEKQDDSYQQEADLESAPIESAPVLGRPGSIRRARSSLGGTSSSNLNQINAGGPVRANAAIGAAKRVPTMTSLTTQTVAQQQQMLAQQSAQKPGLGAARRVSLTPQPTNAQPDYELDQLPLPESAMATPMSSSTRGRARASLGGPPSSLTQSARNSASAAALRAASPAPTSGGFATPSSASTTSTSRVRAASASRARSDGGGGHPPSVTREKSHAVLTSHQMVGTHMPLSPSAVARGSNVRPELQDEPLNHSQRSQVILNLLEACKHSEWSKRVAALESLTALFAPAGPEEAPKKKIPELYFHWDKILFTLKSAMSDVHHRVASAVLACLAAVLTPTTAGGQFTLEELKPILERLIADIFAALSHSKLPIREQANALLNRVTQTFPIEFLCATLIYKCFDSIHSIAAGTNHAKVKLGVLEYLHYLIPLSGNFFRTTSAPTGPANVDGHGIVTINVPLKILLTRIAPFLSANTSSAKASGDPKLKKMTLGICHTLYLAHADTFFPALGCLPVPLNRLVRRSLVETMPDIERLIAENANNQAQLQQQQPQQLYVGVSDDSDHAGYDQTQYEESGVSFRLPSARIQAPLSSQNQIGGGGSYDSVSRELDFSSSTTPATAPARHNPAFNFPAASSGSQPMDGTAQGMPAYQVSPYPGAFSAFSSAQPSPAARSAYDYASPYDLSTADQMQRSYSQQLPSTSAPAPIMGRVNLVVETATPASMSYPAGSSSSFNGTAPVSSSPGPSSFSESYIVALLSSLSAKNTHHPSRQAAFVQLLAYAQSPSTQFGPYLESVLVAMADGINETIDSSNPASAEINQAAVGVLDAFLRTHPTQFNSASNACVELLLRSLLSLLKQSSLSTASRNETAATFSFLTTSAPLTVLLPILMTTVSSPPASSSSDTTASESVLKLCLQTLSVVIDTRLSNEELNRTFMPTLNSPTSAFHPNTLLLDYLVQGLSSCTHENVLLRKLVIAAFVSLHGRVGNQLFNHMAGVNPVLGKLVNIYIQKRQQQMQQQQQQQQDFQQQ